MVPPDDRLARLVRIVREQPSTPAPDWTDGNDSDPGVTLVQVLAFLAEEIGARAPRLPAASRSAVARIGRELARLEPGETPLREASAGSVEGRE